MQNACKIIICTIIFTSFGVLKKKKKNIYIYTHGSKMKKGLSIKTISVILL